jgi:squalene synthase HpnC
MDNGAVQSSFEYCENIAKTHYENFARQADDYADEPGIGTNEERLKLLDEWNRKLADCFTSKADGPIFVALSETVKDCRIPIEPLENLLNAFGQDVVKNRYENFDEVLSYCINSANPIGRLVLLVFGCNDETLFFYSDKICTALQLTNFWQDIKIDLSKNRIYLPKDEMLRFGYGEKELFEFKYNDKFIDLMRFEVERTAKMFTEGEKLLTLISQDNNLKHLAVELKLILSGGRLILQKIKSTGFDVFNKRPVISNLDKIKLFTRSRFI